MITSLSTNKGEIIITQKGDDKVYEKLEKLLKERGMSVHRLVKELEKSPDTRIAKTTFSDWKHGKSKPKADKLKILADYFGVTMEYFMEE